MADLKNISKYCDDSMKQAVFFYELAKMGVVRFDFSNPRHVETLMSMINHVAKIQKMDVSDKPACVQMDVKHRVDLYLLILANILNYSAETYKKQGSAQEKM